MAACSCVNEEAPISEKILVGAVICDGKERDEAINKGKNWDAH